MIRELRFARVEVDEGAVICAKCKRKLDPEETAYRCPSGDLRRMIWVCDRCSGGRCSDRELVSVICAAVQL